ncbi:MAG: GNAT family N-acetyltransferase [Neisseriaceae bacterium]|nr:GNAT family N-acetyltransferase [Neisseriaceae bacterium]
MPQSHHIQLITQLNDLDLRPMLRESQAEGFRFVAKLCDAYAQGRNRFDRPGECLLGAFDATGQLLAIAGLNQDPYQQQRHIGRLRHFYVLAPHRRQGLGSTLLTALVTAARPHFTTLTLRTPGTAASARFYERYGFIAVAAKHHSHQLALHPNGEAT